MKDLASLEGHIDQLVLRMERRAAIHKRVMVALKSPAPEGEDRKSWIIKKLNRFNHAGV